MIIETKKLEDARVYVERMCEGIDPIKVVRSEDPTDFLNDPGFIKSMFFVKTVLDGLKSGELQSKEKTPFPEEILNEFVYTEDMGITNLIKKIYAPLGNSNVQKLSPQLAGLWMRDHCYIENTVNEKLGGDICIPTAKGQKIGLYYKTRDFQGRKFVQIYYSRPAQEFIIKNFRKILDYRKSDTIKG